MTATENELGIIVIVLPVDKTLMSYFSDYTIVVITECIELDY